MIEIGDDHQSWSPWKASASQKSIPETTGEKIPMSDMTTALYVDRSEWDQGPWDNEPDRVEWYDPETDYPCLMLRHPMGHWCGYVAVAPGHPWHGLGYGCYIDGCDDYPCDHRLPDEAHEATHGGITFAESCMKSDTRAEIELVCHVPRPGEPDNVWWLGFDCRHGFDLSPGDAPWAELFKPKAFDREGFTPMYRPMSYVQERCTALAHAAHQASGQ